MENLRFRFNYKRICIGDFDTPEDAARAYDQKAIELFGKFARTNFPRPIDVKSLSEIS
jgi:EREBP-like factor